MANENILIRAYGHCEDLVQQTGPCTVTKEARAHTPAPVTEPLLQNLFDVLGQVESELASRWSSLSGHLATTYQPE